MKKTTKNRSGHSSRTDKLTAVMKKLEDGVKELFTSENYQKYLRTMSQFHQYSFNNTLLIALQKPDATCVASYTTWQQKFHRQVRKGEKGITIIAPVPVRAKREPVSGEPETGTESDPDQKTHLYFKTATVFDISSTDGEPLPTIGVDELTGTAEGYKAFMKALATVSPVPFRFDEIEGGVKGYYHNVNKEIVIQEGMSELQTLKTCIHEISHAMLHDRDHMKAEGIVKNKQQIEQEAESIAFCVCSRFSLDTSSYSFPYIAAFAGSSEMKDLKASMDTIRKTAGIIIDGIETSLDLQNTHVQEQSADRPSLLSALSAEKEKLNRDTTVPASEKNMKIADRAVRASFGKDPVM